MKEFKSKKIILDNKLSINEVLAINLYEKTFNGNIYLLHNHEMVNTKHLSELVTFSLMIEENSEIHFVAEGRNSEEALEEVAEKLQTRELSEAL
ncbi:HPr family phosphocarrier protein [Gracilibacillus oryzae]|uniref:HPr family phosphocarrier protein n=1 Tax=Gracilibacillus oryzae TaxID=1672701 RepID=A0A7C8GVL1_9BACI|nr:HPr family phosphocarrier protein [Gracilibacillus oryzae]KAB8139360.1 HPr family phosphocarrier protein [Gracilibacillus oryzae]